MLTPGRIPVSKLSPAKALITLISMSLTALMFSIHTASAIEISFSAEDGGGSVDLASDYDVDKDVSVSEDAEATFDGEAKIDDSGQLSDIGMVQLSWIQRLRLHKRICDVCSARQPGAFDYTDIR